MNAEGQIAVGQQRTGSVDARRCCSALSTQQARTLQDAKLLANAQKGCKLLLLLVVI